MVSLKGQLTSLSCHFTK